MTNELAHFAIGLDAVVRSVPGVHSVFSVAPQLVRALSSEPGPLTKVGVNDDGIAITCSVGVATGSQARSTAQAVSEAIRNAIASGPLAGAQVHVRVSRVVG